VAFFLSPIESILDLSIEVETVFLLYKSFDNLLKPGGGGPRVPDLEVAEELVRRTALRYRGGRGVAAEVADMALCCIPLYDIYH
jgi:hypothetical protein